MAEIDEVNPNKVQQAFARQKAKMAEGAETSIPDIKTATHSDEAVDPQSVVDLQGRPLQYGNTDPNIIGPDDRVPDLLGKSLRDRSKYSELLPQDLFTAEERWVLPFAVSIATILEVDLIDETTYAKIQKQLKEQFIFCVIDLSNPKIQDGIITWAGLKIWCKEVPVCEVMFHLDTKQELVFIRHIRLWEKARQGHVNVGDPNGLRALTREQGATIISNWLANEQILA